MYHMSSASDPLDELNDCKSGQTSRISKASSFPRHEQARKLTILVLQLVRQTDFLSSVVLGARTPHDGVLELVGDGPAGGGGGDRNEDQHMLSSRLYTPPRNLLVQRGTEIFDRAVPPFEHDRRRVVGNLDAARLGVDPDQVKLGPHVLVRQGLGSSG
jgi:hypothetical protein